MRRAGLSRFALREVFSLDMRKGQRIGHQPALQGIRAVAVLAVFVHHVDLLPGGWLGVEAFFVLSGFLITTLLLQDAQAGEFSLKRFYIRRIARLAPAAGIMLGFLLMASLVVGVDVSDRVGVAAATLLWVANWWTLYVENLPGLGHLWSLSIEEQFYLVWPVVLVTVARKRGSIAIFWVATAGTLVSIFTRVAFISSSDWYTRVYYGTDTRAAGVLTGCAVAALMFHNRDTARLIPWWVGVVAAAMLTAMMAAMPIDARWTWLVGVSIFDILAAIFIVSVIDGQHMVARVLSWRSVVYIGDISYSLYLWHLPIFWLCSTQMDGPARYVAQIVLPFAIAATSYELVEKRVQRWVRSRAERDGKPARPRPISKSERWG